MTRPKTYSLPELRQAIVEAYPQPLRRIAERFDVSVRQVRAVLKAAGVDLRPVGRPAAAERPDVAARLRTLPAPSPALGPPPFPIPRPALPEAQASPAEPGPEPAAVPEQTALEKSVYDFGADLEDDRPILFRCVSCKRPIYDADQRECPCGWQFITVRYDGPRQDWREPGFDPNRSIVRGIFGEHEQW